jgi:hypothetical protein
MHFDQLFGEKQAQTRPCLMVGTASNLPKLLEEPLEVVLIEPPSSIHYIKCEKGALLRYGLGTGWRIVSERASHVHFTLFSELDGVAEKIE